MKIETGYLSPKGAFVSAILFPQPVFTKGNEMEKHEIFLTRNEVIEAIEFDLIRYPVQKLLLRHLSFLILGENSVLSEDSRKSGLWIIMPESGKRRLVSFDMLGELLIKTIKKSSPDIEQLARICGAVFQEKARAGPGKERAGEEAGIWIETGLELFRCRQCGGCCRFLDYHKELTVEDYERFRSMGREDILEWVRPIRQKKRIVSFLIWVDPATGQLHESCPWLKKDSEHNRYSCLIHEIRPRVCREYPGSRKHARMTGCPAFNKS